MSQTVFGDISPRVAAHAQVKLLSRGIPYLCLEQFGQGAPVPTRSSKTTKFRRYESFPATPSALTEGVTPSARKLTNTDITATLAQYGDRVEITDVIMDTHEDPVLAEATDILGEQAANMLETVRYNVIKAGSNVVYSGAAVSRVTVLAVMSLTTQRKVVRLLKRQNARKVTRALKSTPNYATQPVNAAYIGVCHPDCENDIRDMAGFVPVENYGQMTPYEGEIGKCEEVRYIVSTVFTSFADAGAALGGNSRISTGGTNCDVYPILFFGQDAYGIVPLRGKSSITPMVVNPTPSDSDPLAQRGHVGWKAWQTAAILNDAWLVRAEVAATA